MNRNNPIYERGCSLFNASLFALKFDSFSQLYFLKQYKLGIKILFFSVLVTIEPLQFVTTNCLTQLLPILLENELPVGSTFRETGPKFTCTPDNEIVSMTSFIM